MLGKLELEFEMILINYINHISKYGTNSRLYPKREKQTILSAEGGRLSKHR